MTLDEWIKIAPLISCCAIVVSASIAGGVFVYTRRTNRRRATLDMVMKTFLDERGTTLYDDFKNLTRRDQDPQDPFKLESLAEHTPENEKDRNTVIDQLNNYELISLGIRRGLFDEHFYKLWFHRQFTRDFGLASGLIQKVQGARPSVYCEFCALNARWKRKQHPVNHPNRFKLAWWAFTRNQKALDAARAGMNA